MFYNYSITISGTDEKGWYEIVIFQGNNLKEFKNALEKARKQDNFSEMTIFNINDLL